MDARSQWSGFDAGRLARIGEHIERAWLAPGVLAGCQVVVARHGHIAYAKSFGLMDRERGRPVQDDAIWRIYSMTKPITSVALMMLYERGRFQLDEPVANHVPAWRDQKVWVSGLDADDLVTERAHRPVSFRDLLRHTSGLTYGGLLGPHAELPLDLLYQAEDIRGRGSTDSPQSFLEKLGRLPLAYQPGTAWLYSLATDACGALVEVISGRPFERFLQEEIFGPLGMADTGFHVPAEKLDRLAAYYRQEPGGTLSLVEDPAASAYAREPVFKSGGAGLASTTADYLRFCEMLRRGGELDGERILGPRTVELMHQNHLPGGADIAELALSADVCEVQPGVGFGLGFANSLGQAPTRDLGACDYYWGGAASTLFWVDPKEDMSVVFMTQLMPTELIDFRGPLKSLVYSAIVD
ncbi:serine hydrolase [Phenylobacterium sp. LjRoot219]|uniref:serine hydrolase domain-containing protein n=1 Tax=Phenylobacterium sp. LjRoot219 TaxID=3342283 RepID=UPI003ECE3C1C